MPMVKKNIAWPMPDSNHRICRIMTAFPSNARKAFNCLALAIVKVNPGQTGKIYNNRQIPKD